MRALCSFGMTVAMVVAVQPASASPQTSVGAPPVVMPSGAPDTFYKRPAYGYRLAKAWTDAQFYIADYRRYRLPRPARGFGWSRYYDEAVLTDQWGRVYDVQSNVDWDRPRHGRRHRDDDLDYQPHWTNVEAYSEPAGEVVTTVVTRKDTDCTMVPYQVVSYDTVYAPAPRAAVLPRTAKERRTVGVRPRVRGDY